MNELQQIKKEVIENIYTLQNQIISKITIILYGNGINASKGNTAIEG